VSTAFVSLALDPTNPEIVYAGTGLGHNGCGLLKGDHPTENGIGWTDTKLGGVSSFSQRVPAVATASGTTVYAYSADDLNPLNTGLFRTTDGGVTWNPVNDLPESEQTDCYSSLAATGVRALALDHAAPSTLYAGTSVGVFRTTNADGGATWFARSTGLPSSPQPCQGTVIPLAAPALAIEPGVPAMAYVGVTYDNGFSPDPGVFATTD